MTYTQANSASDISAKPVFVKLVVSWARHVGPLMFSFKNIYSLVFEF